MKHAICGICGALVGFALQRFGYQVSDGVYLAVLIPSAIVIVFVVHAGYR